MADLSTTISFKAPEWLVEWLRAFASKERRKVGAMVRIIIEERKAQEDGKRDGEI